MAKRNPLWMELIKFAPAIMQAVGMIRKSRGGQEGDVKEMKADVDDLRKRTEGRIEETEQAVTSLKSRIKELESTMALQQVLLWIIGGLAVVTFFIAIISMLTRGQ